MNDNDYAIVVGISDYPHFGATPLQERNLQGPDDDAAAIHAWLTDPDKGGVPTANATLIRSRDFKGPGVPPPPKPQPERQAIIDAFDALEGKAQANDLAGNGLRVGRRLYVYMSGHGFSPRRKEGAVFVADATRQRTNHVFATRWLEWFYNAEYFNEFVLWMDCCMVFDLAIVPESAGYRVLMGGGTGALFSAYAARFPLQAVERTMADGKVHGAFTWALLEGLNGAAANPVTREVTSDTLKNYLINNMKTFMEPPDLEDSSVSKEPDFGADDPMLLCTVASVPQAQVDFTTPPGLANQKFTVVTGTPPTPVASGTFANGPTRIGLPPGVYFLKAPGVSRGFEVQDTRGVQVNV